ncbi:MAG: hypothetical protein PHS38_13070 [Bacteroidales bacterium]|nr:hypothetical protein [Bacteroidales bacterium]
MKKILTVLTLIVCLNAFGQNSLKTYSGEMKTPKDILGERINSADQGQVNYSYFELEDGTRVKHGKFEFNYFNIFYNYSVVGQYIDGKKEGIWIMTTYGDNNKELNKVTVTYKEDKLNGPYKAIINGFVDYMICTGEMKDNHYISVATIETPPSSGTVNGTFNQSGWAHGTWQVERKKGIPLKQEREYFEGFLIKVTETDFASGEKTILYEMPVDEASDIRNTFNEKDSTVYIGGERYKRVQGSDPDNSDNYSDCRVFLSGMKTISEIYEDDSEPTMKQFIPLVNGFADLKMDYEWSLAKRQEEARIAKEKETEERAEFESLFNKVEENDKLIDQEYYSYGKSISNVFGSNFKKPSIYNAYILVIKHMDINSRSSIIDVLEIQEVMLKLASKKTKDVEKVLNSKNDPNDIILFFKTEALSLSK